MKFDWATMKPILFVVATALVTITGGVAATNNATEKGKRKVRAVEQRCDSTTSVLRAWQDSVLFANAVAKAKAEARSEARATAIAKSYAPKQKGGGVWGWAGPALGFVGGVVVGHVWNHNPASAVVHVVSEVVTKDKKSKKKKRKKRK